MPGCSYCGTKCPDVLCHKYDKLCCSETCGIACWIQAIHEGYRSSTPKMSVTGIPYLEEFTLHHPTHREELRVLAWQSETLLVAPKCMRCLRKVFDPYRYGGPDIDLVCSQECFELEDARLTLVGYGAPKVSTNGVITTCTYTHTQVVRNVEYNVYAYIRMYK